MERRIAEIARLVDVYASFNQSAGRREVIVANGVMKRIAAIDCARIDIGQVGTFKIG